MRGIQNFQGSMFSCWFVGLNLEDRVWDYSTFSANR